MSPMAVVYVDLELLRVQTSTGRQSFTFCVSTAYNSMPSALHSEYHLCGISLILLSFTKSVHKC